MRFIRRLAFWWRLRANHSDLRDELEFHREMLEGDLVRRGWSPADTHAHAKLTMGNETFMREEARSVWLWPSLEAIWQDVSYTCRGLARNPTFALGVILTLALGIGANAAMFSLVDRLLFRPPALMIDPATVHRVYMYRTNDGRESETGGQYARYVDMARGTPTAVRTAAFTFKPLAVGSGEATLVRNVGIVTASFFEFFNAPPVVGRYYTQEEDAPPNPAPVAVISHSLWMTQFAGRGDAIGSTLQIDAVAYTIIGVAPDEFVGLWPYKPPAAFIPVATFAQNRVGRNWQTTYGSAFGLEMIMRRRSDVTLAAASADLTNAVRRSFQSQIEAEGHTRSLELLRPRAVAASVLPERGPEASSIARVSVWLSGVTLIVLLIACANVMNLMLARTIRRRREIAVRVALGVSRRRLFAQVLLEGMLLALFGGAAGVALAVWGGNVLSATFLPGTERVSLLTDPRTLVFTSAVALATGLLTSLAPIVQVRRGNLTADLKSAARDGTYQRASLRSALLLLQTALCAVLLAGAGMFVRSLQHVRDVPLGFDADSVLLVSLQMRNVKLDRSAAAALRLRLLSAAKGVPGVSYVTNQESTPFYGESSYPIFVPGIDSVEKFGQFDVNAVSADYFRAMGTRIMRGRGFEDSDREGTQPVVVVGASMAATLWPGKEPLGQCVKLWADSMPCRSVVGVAENIHSQSIEAEPKLFFYYLPAAQWKPEEGGLFVRVGGDARHMVEVVRHRLQREMPGTAFVTVTPLENIVDTHMRSWIVGAKIFTAFGALALVLAALGLYSVIAYNVEQRQHELGVRLALGAVRGGIVRLVVTQSLRFAVVGLVVGGLGVLAGGRWIAPLLFQQSPNDPGVLGAVSLVLISVAVVASAFPAWRAARLDPRSALQAD